MAAFHDVYHLLFKLTNNIQYHGFTNEYMNLLLPNSQIVTNAKCCMDYNFVKSIELVVGKHFSGITLEVDEKRLKKCFLTGPFYWC